MSDTPLYPTSMSDRDNARLFNQLVRPTLTGASRESPTVPFVAGPPGAGKTTVHNALLQRLGRTEAFPLDGDDLLSFHPRHTALSQDNDHGSRPQARRLPADRAPNDGDPDGETGRLQQVPGRRERHAARVAVAPYAALVSETVPPVASVKPMTVVLFPGTVLRTSRRVRRRTQECSAGHGRTAGVHAEVPHRTVLGPMSRAPKDRRSEHRYGHRSAHQQSHETPCTDKHRYMHSSDD